MYTYICLKCTQFLKINAGNSLSVALTASLGNTTDTANVIPVVC